MKNIGKYFFELIAIFIGITASFMVENYRVKNERKEEIVFALETVKSGMRDDIKSLERNVNLIKDGSEKMSMWGDQEFIRSLEPEELINYYRVLGAAVPFNSNRAGYSIYVESSGKELISNLDLRRHLGQYYQVEAVLVESNSAIDWDITKDFLDHMISTTKDFPPSDFVSNQNSISPSFEEHIKVINEDIGTNMLNSRLLIFQTNLRLFSDLLEEAKMIEVMLDEELAVLE